MTIGRTGNSIVDGLARAKSRAQAADERARASAKKAAGRSKTTAKAKRGRAAIRSSKGRGVAGSSHKNRAGAGASIQYAIDKPDAKLISSNAGMDSKDIAASFRLAQGSRPDIKKNTGHISFSLPSGEKLTDNQWSKLADRARAELGLDDGFPFVAGLHEDTSHQHLHITYCRVAYDGRAHDDRFIKLRLAAVEDNLEKEFSLKIIPKEEFIKAPRYTIGEAAMSARTGIQPPRFIIDTAVRATLSAKPKDPISFIQGLAAQGIIARPAVKNGKVSGFSFQYGGVEFGASKINNKFGWSKLQKEINYEPERDDKKLAELPANGGGDARGLRGKPTAESSVESAVERVDEGARIVEPVVKTESAEIPPVSDPLEFLGLEEHKPVETFKPVKSAPADSRRDDRRADNSFYLISDMVRVKMFPHRDEVLEKLINMKGEQQAMAWRLAEIIRKYDYAKDEMATEFLKEFEASAEAVNLFVEYVPNVLSSHIQEVTEPFEKARQEATRWAERMRHSPDTQSNDHQQDVHNVPTM